jgi:hypothetical protein
VEEVEVGWSVVVFGAPDVVVGSPVLVHETKTRAEAATSTTPRNRLLTVASW